LKAVTKQIQDCIKAFHNDMTAWRRDLHAQPGLGFEEHRTQWPVYPNLRPVPRPWRNQGGGEGRFAVQRR